MTLNVDVSHAKKLYRAAMPAIKVQTKTLNYGDALRVSMDDASTQAHKNSSGRAAPTACGCLTLSKIVLRNASQANAA